MKCVAYHQTALDAAAEAQTIADADLAALRQTLDQLNPAQLVAGDITAFIKPAAPAADGDPFAGLV